MQFHSHQRLWMHKFSAWSHLKQREQYCYDINSSASASADMVPYLIWAPYFFDPREIWALRNLVLEKFSHHMIMPYNDFQAGTKFLRAQRFRCPNFLVPKKVKGLNDIGDHFSTSPFLCLVWLDSVQPIFRSGPG